jgi:hypothetical protein
VDGATWKKRIGWNQVLAGIKKAMPRTVREKTTAFGTFEPFSMQCKLLV